MRRLESSGSVGSQRGFSLLELMVVVAVIAIITAIAIPNLQAGLKTARRTAAYTNIKVLEGAIQTYMLDKDAPPLTLGTTTLDPLVSGRYLSKGQRKAILRTLDGDRISWYWAYDGGFGWDYEYILEFRVKKDTPDAWCYLYPEGIWRWDNTDGWQQVM